MVNSTGLCMLLYIVQAMLRLGDAQDCGMRSQAAQQNSTGQPGLTFMVSPIQNNVGRPDVAIEKMTHTVNGCVLILFVKSAPINLGFLVSLAGETVTCFRKQLDGTVTQVVVARAKMLKFQKSSIERPDPVPTSWYEGDGAVLAITYDTFPDSTQESMRCLASFTVLVFDVKLWLDVDTSAEETPTKVSDTMISTTTSEPPVSALTNASRLPTSSQSSHTTPTTNGGQNLEAEPTDRIRVLPNTTILNSAVRQPNHCHIPARADFPENPGEGALQFSFHEISINGKTFPWLTVEDHLYKVEQCKVTLFAKSSIVEGVDGLKDYLSLVSGQSVQCQSTDPSQTSLTATPLYFMGKTNGIPRPRMIPPDWFSGNRIVIQLEWKAFPEPPVTTDRLSCFITVIMTFRLSWGVDTIVVGCPEGKWGTSCENECTCAPQRNCHTFSGHCLPDIAEVTSHPTTLKAKSRASCRLSCCSLTMIAALFLLIRFWQ